MIEKTKALLHTKNIQALKKLEKLRIEVDTRIALVHSTFGLKMNASH